MSNLNLSKLSCALAALSLTSLAGAAGLDRSGQPSEDFSSSGTIAYISAYQISPDISGKESNGDNIPDIGEKYEGYGYGVKTDINDRFSVGVFYDQPLGAKILYQGDNSLTNINAVNNDRKQTVVDVSTDNFTGLLGVNLGANNNFKIYGGPVLQKIEGELAINSKNPALAAVNGYTLNIPKNEAYGYMVGAAYVKPEIGLKAAITYRSEIDHDVNYAESMPYIIGVNTQLPPALRLEPTQTKEKELTTPKSVNIDFQTGLNATTLLTAKARWVPWSGFNITPPLLDENGVALNALQGKVVDEVRLLEYDKDSYMLEVGLGKRLTPKFAVSGSIGWDSGAGNPVSPLGPTEGYYSVGLGAKYNLTPEWAVSAGAKYLMLGDAEGLLASSGTKIGQFEDNDAYLVGLKLSYAAK
ncbi:outer membrane protein transport protein [Psychrobacter sp. DAB_AL43B]|uniref:outer membrane protein transport protein n=1 Tax=Psychrobacter sp. DAB_AL43B TaxID=1028416 RepID=UPI0009A57C09|nr:outer membrane protein transport protein [Psychrobacter sp. DAB_AL43B]SLJ84709.1 long-chain fatty acid transport protein [Psychrobacter sp. DAB_AL43B]